MIYWKHLLLLGPATWLSLVFAYQIARHMQDRAPDADESRNQAIVALFAAAGVSLLSQGFFVLLQPLPIAPDVVRVFAMAFTGLVFGIVHSKFGIGEPVFALLLATLGGGATGTFYVTQMAGEYTYVLIPVVFATAPLFAISAVYSRDRLAHAGRWINPRGDQIRN